MKPSALHIRFFTLYTRWLMWRRFKAVDIKSEYRPKNGASTLFFGNHSYWWDALIPLILNADYYNQDLRAVMERKQTEQWPFFLKLGALPIAFGDLTDLKKLLSSCDQLFSRPNTSLWLYPEGRIIPLTQSPARFQPLIAKLATTYQHIDLALVVQYLDASQADKPVYRIRIYPFEVDRSDSRTNILKKAENFCKTKLDELSLVKDQD